MWQKSVHVRSVYHLTCTSRLREAAAPQLKQLLLSLQTDPQGFHVQEGSSTSLSWYSSQRHTDGDSKSRWTDPTFLCSEERSGSKMQGCTYRVYFHLHPTCLSWRTHCGLPQCSPCSHHRLWYKVPYSICVRTPESLSQTTGLLALLRIQKTRLPPQWIQGP